MKTFEIPTTQREIFVDITKYVREIIKASTMNDGACLVYCPHTTAGVTMNECADPAVALDMTAALSGLVGDGGHWRHLEGNSPAHIKASLMGCSVMVPFADGEIEIGRWQGIFLCEFDGPRMREVWVQVLS